LRNENWYSKKRNWKRRLERKRPIWAEGYWNGSGLWCELDRKHWERG